jgi:hypothetical protein
MEYGAVERPPLELRKRGGENPPPEPRQCGSGGMLKRLPARFALTPDWGAVILPVPAAVPAGETPLAPRACFIHCQGATVEVLAVQIGDRTIRFLGIRHFDECEAARATGVTIRDQVDLQNLSETLEGRPQTVLGRLKAQISYKNILHFYSPALHRSKAFNLVFATGSDLLRDGIEI